MPTLSWSIIRDICGKRPTSMWAGRASPLPSAPAYASAAALVSMALNGIAGIARVGSPLRVTTDPEAPMRGMADKLAGHDYRVVVHDTDGARPGLAVFDT
jgi:hypothetical protein